MNKNPERPKNMEELMSGFAKGEYKKSENKNNDGKRNKN